jgi:hypothetical protein
MGRGRKRQEQGFDEKGEHRRKTCFHNWGGGGREGGSLYREGVKIGGGEGWLIYKKKPSIKEKWNQRYEKSSRVSYFFGE